LSQSVPMGWGWGRRYGYHQPVGKKAAAASLSTSTLQRILEQQKEQERREVQRSQAFAVAMVERQRKEAEERALEEKHGGKEALAKWRFDNAAKIEQERREAAETARAAAAEKAAVDALAELQAEIAKLPVTEGGLQLGVAGMNLNKTTIKQHFHLTDKDLEALPKNVVMKEGAKKASSITWNGKDIVAAVIGKFGQRQLRGYLAAAYPGIARLYIADEIALLETKHTGLGAKARAAAVEKLRAADADAAAEVSRLEEALAKATAALEAGRTKHVRARDALETFASAAELDKLWLPPIGQRSTEAGGSSCTPFTAGQQAGPPAKKAKLSGGKAKMAELVD